MTTAKSTTKSTDHEHDEVMRRLARVEYMMSRVDPRSINVRSFVTNPIDDPDDPPADTGTWEGHDWYFPTTDETTDDNG